MSKVTKFVIGYKVKKSQVQRLIPRNFHVCTGALRFTIEMIENAPWLNGEDCVRIELNAPVSKDDVRGWFNLVTWENCWVSPSEKRDIPTNTALRADTSIVKSGINYLFNVWCQDGNAPFLSIELERRGEKAGYPNEEDNDGTFYYSNSGGEVKCYFKPIEHVYSLKEPCIAAFSWDMKQLSDIPRRYKHLPLICKIKNERIIGSYMVVFDREVNSDDSDGRYEQII